MAITTKEIHQAADQLQEQNIKPTLAEVRKALNGGSFTTISEAMKSWRQDHKDEQELKKVELPSGIDERLQALGADMWQTALDIAQNRMTKEREGLEVIKAKAQQDVDELSESVKTLEVEQIDLLKQLDDVTAAADTATATADAAMAERNALTKLLNDTEHKLEIERNKADSAQSQLVEVRKRLDKTQSELTESLSHVAKLEAQADNSKIEVERLSADVKASKSDLKLMKDDFKSVTAERDKLSTDTAEIKGELRAVTAERDKQNTVNETIMSNNEKLNKANATLEAERKAIDKALSDLTTSYQNEQEQTAQLKDELKQIKNKLTKAQATAKKQE